MGGPTEFTDGEALVITLVIFGIVALVVGLVVGLGLTLVVLALRWLLKRRAADRLKHLAGPELGAGAFLKDVAPEAAAAYLRQAPTDPP